MKSTGPKRTTDQLLSDRRLTAQLYLREWTQEEIAAEINRRRDEERAAENTRIGADNARRVAEGLAPLDLLPYPAADRHITQQTVSNDIQALRRAWRAEAEVDVAAAVAEELAELAELKRTYWRAWEESRGEIVKTHTEAVTDEKAGTGTSTRGAHLPAAGKKTRVTRDVSHAAGDPSFLLGIERVLKRRAALLGADPAGRLVLEGNPDKPLSVNLTDPALLKTMTDEELKLLDALHDKLAHDTASGATAAAAGGDPGGAAPPPL